MILRCLRITINCVFILNIICRHQGATINFGIEIAFECALEFMITSTWCNTAEKAAPPRSWIDLLCFLKQDESNKAGKSQGSAEWPLARSSLEKGYQAQRAARQLRDHHHRHHHHHHYHSRKLPSNLDVLELHTLEVLKRLEVGPLEEVSA